MLVAWRDHSHPAGLVREPTGPALFDNKSSPAPSACKVLITGPRLAQFGSGRASGRSYAARRRSAEADRFEIIIGLDDLAQPIFRGAISAIGVGMMPLHERLEPSLDLLCGGIRFEPKRIERLALGITHPAGLLAAPPCASDTAEFPEKTEGIIRTAELGTKTRGMGARGRLSPVHPHLPSRTVADHGFLLVAGNIFGAHAGEEIVGMVVLAHVFEAKPPIFTLAQPSLRGAVGRGRLAIRPFAGRALGAQPTIFIGFDPDAIEEGRVAFHDRSVCALSGAIFKS